jgi:phosphoglycolate phosphatase-like HAD superfamily hydrolase
MAKVVVLDVDETLMDTNYLHVEARAFEETGHRIPRVKLHKEVGKGSELLIREFVDDEETVEKSKNCTARSTVSCRSTATRSLAPMS